MECAVKNLENKDAGKISLGQKVFGLAPIRKDIILRVNLWQLAKRQAGTHQTKTISDIQGTTKKPHPQKGTGRARQGSLRSAQMRGGATIFGPQSRSHAFKLPKKVRALGLRMAISAKQAEGKLMILDDLKLAAPKTQDLKSKLTKMGITSALMIGGEVLDENFAKAAANIPHMDVLPVQGINVYDILRRDTLILSREAVEKLEARFSHG